MKKKIKLYYKYQKLNTIESLSFYNIYDDDDDIKFISTKIRLCRPLR